MDINRFVKAYKSYGIVAEEEIRNGRKESHWMWFIFPQVRGLGTSIISNYYGMDGIEEAQLFYANKMLKKGLRKLTKLVLRLRNEKRLQRCFGSVDTMKLKSSMTIFYLATNEKLFKKVLDKFFQGCLDKQTMILLNYEV